MDVLFTQEEIESGIQIIADQLNEKHTDDKHPLVFIGVLNGCFMFYSELVKRLKFNIECDFVRVKSYSGRNQGEINLIKDIEVNIKGKHIYLIDDILDTGETIKYLIDHFKFSKPKSISVSTLLTRETSPKISKPLYTAFTLTDEWIVGYGCDGKGGYYRNNPSILKM
jgi:hypoxanthine phosphoribosyltransferase